MLIKRSDLKLDNFTMLSCSFASIPSTRKLSSEALKKIPVDIDFDILRNKNNSSKIKIMLELSSQQSDNFSPGYKYSVICSAEYSIKGLSKKSET